MFMKSQHVRNSSYGAEGFPYETRSSVQDWIKSTRFRSRKTLKLSIQAADSAEARMKWGLDAKRKGTMDIRSGRTKERTSPGILEVFTCGMGAGEKIITGVSTECPPTFKILKDVSRP